MVGGGGGSTFACHQWPSKWDLEIGLDQTQRKSNKERKYAKNVGITFLCSEMSMKTRLVKWKRKVNEK